MDHLLIVRDAILDDLKHHPCRAQERMKEQADKHMRDGDVVYLMMQPHKLKSLAKRTIQKLSPRFYGTFEVESRVEAVTCKLRLPDYSCVHPVVNVSYLKRQLMQACPARNY